MSPARAEVVRVFCFVVIWRRSFPLRKTHTYKKKKKEHWTVRKVGAVHTITALKVKTQQ